MKQRDMSLFSIMFITLCLLFPFSCTQQEPPQEPVEGKPFQIIMITDVGGLGDKGFNDIGWEGCQLAKQRLEERGAACETKVIESVEQTDYADNLALAAERADVVVALGFLMTDAVQQAAERYPDQPFLITDGRVEAPNVVSVLFKEEEGGFLAGLLASFVSNTNVVGVMPGMDIPPVRAFATGYKAGALTGGALQDRDVKVLDSTIGSFTDPVKAKTLAHQLLNQDADILFALAGLSGLGVIKAVEEDEARNFVIGVDVDQDDISPGNVLASVLKRNDLVIADQIVKIYEDEFTGGTKNVGVKDGYIHLSEMKHTKHLVPPQGLAALEGAKVLLAEEQFTIPRTEKGLGGFTPPVQRLR